MKSVLQILLLALFSIPVFSQKIAKPEDAGCTLIKLASATEDSVQFLVNGTGADLQRKKPVFLFIQGSLPNPLLLYDEHVYGVFPFKTGAYRDSFHFVVVSKPGIPVIADTRTLDAQMCYKDKATGRFPAKYVANNHLDFYVQQHREVLAWLAQQPWVDISKIVVCGGSQGATVAAKLATAEPTITHLIYYSGNPNGRLDEEVRRIQQDVAMGKMSGEKALTKLTEVQQYWAWLYANAESTDDTHGDPPKTTVSFSKPAREYLTQLNIPVLVAFGTADLTAAPCATLPLDFLRKGKTNLTLKIYPNYDHHFFEKKAEGGAQQYRLNEAFEEWMKWVN